MYISWIFWFYWYSDQWKCSELTEKAAEHFEEGIKENINHFGQQTLHTIRCKQLQINSVDILEILVLCREKLSMEMQWAVEKYHQHFGVKYNIHKLPDGSHTVQHFLKGPNVYYYE